MAQVSMSVRLDSQLKKQFNELCNEIGMSVNTAINVFVNAAVKRKMAESGKFPEMTLEEINEEIRQAREERSKQK